MSRESARQNEWPLPRGLFAIPTSPVTPSTPSTRFSNTHAFEDPTLPSRPRLGTLLYYSARRWYDHGMNRSHPLPPKPPSQDPPQQARSKSPQNKQVVQPVPWPMPPRIAPEQNHENADINTTCTANSSLKPSLSHSSSQDSYRTPPDSIPEESHAGQIPQAVFDHIEKLYPPAFRSPALADANNPTMTTSSSALSQNNSEISEVLDLSRTPSQCPSSQSSDSVVDVLQLFTDMDGGDEEKAEFQLPFEDYIRMNRQAAPIPRGKGDMSFLNVSGLRSLFTDDNTETLSPNSRRTRPLAQMTAPSDIAASVKRVSALRDIKPEDIAGVDNSRFQRSLSELVPSKKGSKQNHGDKPPVKSSSTRSSMSSSKSKKRKSKKKDNSEMARKGSNAQCPESAMRTPCKDNTDELENGAQGTQNDTEVLNTSETTMRTQGGTLRRPIASRHRTYTAPLQKTQDPTAEVSKAETSAHTGHQAVDDDEDESDIDIKEESKMRQQKGTGVVMRDNPRRPPMVGIRRAETGFIMTRAELQARKSPSAMRENPNPKSLALFNMDEVVTQAIIPEMDINLSDNSEEGLDEPISRSLVNLHMEKRERSAATSNSSSALSRMSRNGRHDGRVVNMQVDDRPFGLVNRLKRAAWAVTKKAVIAETPRNSANVSETSDMTLRGTLDETVCRICYVCRTVLNMHVEVRESGRKVHIESQQHNIANSVRVTLLITELETGGSAEPRSCIKVQRRRGDVNRTNVTTLWEFYKKLETALRESEHNGVVE